MNQINETQYSTALLMGEVHFRIFKKAHLRNVEKNINLTSEQLGILYILSNRRDTIQSDLAEWCGKDKSAVMRHLDALEEKKMVVRVNDSTDRRRKILVITKAGHDTLAKALQSLTEVFEEVSKTVSEEKMQIFREVLLQLRQNTD